MKNFAILLAITFAIGCDRETSKTSDTQTASAVPTPKGSKSTSELSIRRDDVGIPIPPPGYKLHRMAPAMGIVLPEGWNVEPGRWREADRTTPITVNHKGCIIVLVAAPESNEFPEPPDAVSRGLDNLVIRNGKTADTTSTDYVYDVAIVPKGIALRGRLLAKSKIEQQAKRIWFWGAGPEADIFEVVAAARKGLVVD